MNPTDKFIAAGFWSQLILLILVDWGSIASFLRGDGAWYHYIAFVVVNVVLLTATWRVWGWMQTARETTDEDPPEHG